MSGTTRWIYALGLTLTACGPDKSSSADPGQETGPCLASACFPGLVCLSDLCVAGDGSDSTMTNTDGVSMSGASDDPSAASTPTSNDPTTTTADPTATQPGTVTDDPSNASQVSTTTNDPSNSSDPGSTSTPGTASEPGTTTGESTTSTTGEPGGFGQCGWDSNGKYYACAVDGATPGLVDPDGVSPIQCAPGLVKDGPCPGEKPVDAIGCCTPEGVLFFCDGQTDPNSPSIFRQDCGA